MKLDSRRPIRSAEKSPRKLYKSEQRTPVIIAKIGRVTARKSDIGQKTGRARLDDITYLAVSLIWTLRTNHQGMSGNPPYREFDPTGSADFPQEGMFYCPRSVENRMMICMRNALRLSICGVAMPASLAGGRKK